MDKVIGLLNAYYFQQNFTSPSLHNSSMNINPIITPPRTANMGNNPSGDQSVTSEQINDSHHYNNANEHHAQPSSTNLRESSSAINFLNSLKSPPLGVGSVSNTP